MAKLSKYFFPICFMLICIFFLFTPQLSAQGTHLLSNGPRIKKIDAGFGGMYRTAITSYSNETDINLQGVSIWTLHTFVSQYTAHTSGGLASHLTLTSQPKSKVTGAVTNTLPYALNDAYLLIGGNFAPLGTLASEQTKLVTLGLELLECWSPITFHY